MFDPADTPRIYGVQPGVDFAQALTVGLTACMQPHPPHMAGQIDLYLNTERMRRRVKHLYQTNPLTIIPNLKLVTELPLWAPHKRQSPLGHMLEISDLVRPFLDAQPDLAGKSALYDLSNSLMDILDEMQIENVPFDTIAALDVTDESGHWDRALQFLQIVQTYLKDHNTLTPAQIQRRATDALITAWAYDPPQQPVIVAGSTGSRGTTFDLMRAVATLPNGAIILPGFDFDLPTHVWDRLAQDPPNKDHPQYQFAKLLVNLDMTPDQVQGWSHLMPPAPARNVFTSLALRPAPVTHQWMEDGPKLQNLETAFDHVTWLEAPDQRAEAITIAAKLRQCLADGKTAAVVTPDRSLTRRIAAALHKWGITPDDSAGIPLSQSPPGRVLLHMVDVLKNGPALQDVLTVLKHPLVHTGTDRGPHLKHTRDLELYARANGYSHLTPDILQDWGKGADDRLPWLAWYTATFAPPPQDAMPLHNWATYLDQQATMASAGGQDDPDSQGTLWAEEAGRETQAALQNIKDASDHTGDVSLFDFQIILRRVLQSGTVRQQSDPHPDITIWGALEARAQGADVTILAGLNETIWPATPNPDPWLNRRMRRAAGLLLPERNIGLSAHDFQISFASDEVWVARSMRAADAETVPSRWLNRFRNLLNGLTPHETNPLLNAMMARGQAWLAAAQTLETPIQAEKAKRPAPCPPVSSRPKELPVTGITKLIRDPYAIYARYILGLRPLNPLTPEPNALMRGNIIHDILDDAMAHAPFATVDDGATTLMNVAEQSFDKIAPWPTQRMLWLALIGANAPWFMGHEMHRQHNRLSVQREIRGKTYIPLLDFTLTAKADRIDLYPDGAHVYDYKTGAPPSKGEQNFDKQLILEIEMLRRGAFNPVTPRTVMGGTYIGMGKNPIEMPAAPDPDCWTNLQRLISAYQQPNQGFTARRALLKVTDFTDYDHLSRYGEWDTTDTPQKVVIT
ncbi:MAG: double-strand break repair protein AddB [Pseudomonadota bacterium]